MFLLKSEGRKIYSVPKVAGKSVKKKPGAHISFQTYNLVSNLCLMGKNVKNVLELIAFYHFPGIKFYVRFYLDGLYSAI